MAWWRKQASAATYSRHLQTTTPGRRALTSLLAPDGMCHADRHHACLACSASSMAGPGYIKATTTPAILSILTRMLQRCWFARHLACRLAKAYLKTPCTRIVSHQQKAWREETTLYAAFK